MPIFAKECICSFTMVEQTAERSKMYKKEKKVCMMYDESMYQIVRIEFLIQKKTTRRKKTKQKNKEDKKRREDGLALNKSVLPQKDFLTKCSHAASSGPTT